MSDLRYIALSIVLAGLFIGLGIAYSGVLTAKWRLSICESIVAQQSNIPNDLEGALYVCKVQDFKL